MRLWASWGREEEYEGIKCLSVIIIRWLKSTGMPRIPDLHLSLIMLFNKCLMC